MRVAKSLYVRLLLIISKDTMTPSALYATADSCQFYDDDEILALRMASIKYFAFFFQTILAVGITCINVP
jgi:hypothetical protein